MLTETSVRATDRRAVFVFVDAYEAAGGIVLRDFVQSDDNGSLADPALLDRLVSEKLQPQPEALTANGWKWIEVATDLPYGYSHGLRRLAGDPAPMTDEESAANGALLAEYRALQEEYSGQDEYPEKIDARIGQLEVAMEALEQRPLIYAPAGPVTVLFRPFESNTRHQGDRIWQRHTRFEFKRDAVRIATTSGLTSTLR